MTLQPEAQGNIHFKGNFIIFFYKQMRAQRLKPLHPQKLYLMKPYKFILATLTKPALRAKQFNFTPRAIPTSSIHLRYSQLSSVPSPVDPQPGWANLRSESIRQSRVNRAYITRCQRGRGSHAEPPRGLPTLAS